MDILHLVDRLEELFNDSRPIPLTHSVIINEDRESSTLLIRCE